MRGTTSVDGPSRCRTRRACSPGTIGSLVRSVPDSWALMPEAPRSRFKVRAFTACRVPRSGFPAPRAISWSPRGRLLIPQQSTGSAASQRTGSFGALHRMPAGVYVARAQISEAHFPLPARWLVGRGCRSACWDLEAAPHRRLARELRSEPPIAHYPRDGTRVRAGLPSRGGFWALLRCGP